MVSVIHNSYQQNKYFRESVLLNVRALEESSLEYQYIIFNDNGDKKLLDEVKDLLSDKVEYYYSPVNFGMKVCSGGWVGAIPLLKGTYVHNTGQDDVFSFLFYKKLVEHLQSPDVYLAYANGFKTLSNLVSPGEVFDALTPLDYSNPRAVFNSWFGVKNNTPTQANNFIPAPGVIYKKELHDLIGEPDLVNFKGSADFEYWARILFYGYGVSYEPTPLWLYRISEFSLGSKPAAEEEAKNNNNRILEKFAKLMK